MNPAPTQLARRLLLAIGTLSLVSALAPLAPAAEREIRSTQGNTARLARVWVPDDVPQVRGLFVVWKRGGEAWDLGNGLSSTSVATPGFSTTGTTVIFYDPEWREFLSGLGFGMLLQIGGDGTDIDASTGSNNDPYGGGDFIHDVLAQLGADASLARPELSTAPLVQHGFSRTCKLASSYASYWPGRAAGFIQHMGEDNVANTGVNPSLSAAGQVPGLLVAGQNDTNTLTNYQSMLPMLDTGRDADARWATGLTWGIGHGGGPNGFRRHTIIFPWLASTLNQRLPAAVPAPGQAPVLRLPAATYLGNHLADFVHGPASSFFAPRDMCWLPGPAFGAVWKTYFDNTATSTANTDALAQTLVTASPLRASLAENSPANTIAFGLVRTGSAASRLTVNLAWSGTATPGADYATPPATVTFPAGQRSARIALTPVADALAESAETITLTPSLGTGYAVSDSPAATVTLGSAGSGTTSFTLTTNAVNGGIARSPDQASYPAGTVVTLTATPASGYTFSGWSGDLTGTTNPASITLNANRSVTANFSIQTSTTVRVAEPFAYAAGVLEGQGLVSGNWTGAWTKVVGTDSANVLATGLTYAGLSATAGKVAKTAIGTGNAISYRRSFSPGTLFNAGNSVWFSALLRPTTTTGGVHLMINNGGGSSQAFGVTVNSGTLRARVGTTLSASTLPAPVNTTTLVVGRIDTSATGNETVTVWTNPDLVAGPSGPSGPGVSASANYDTAPGSVLLITNGANSTWEADEIRVGPSFDSVTP